MTKVRHYGLQNPTSFGVKGKRRYAMVVDLTRCTGCMECSLACKAEFDTPLGVMRTWVKVIERGQFPNVQRRFIPRFCNHCDNPPCVRACPVQATFKHEDGYVLQRYNRCIGCRTCMIACPYNARHLLPADRSNPHDPTRVADKCTFCVHRVERGLAPACVAACTANALIFGDINDPDSEVAKLVGLFPTDTIKKDLGTRPQVYYIGLEDMDNVESYHHRSAQMKKEFNTFKRNYPNSHFMHGDMLEEEQED